VECGLSSILHAKPRPSDQPEHPDHNAINPFRQLTIWEGASPAGIIALFEKISPGEDKMRTPMVAGNWKMNKTVEEARTLVADMLPGLLEFKSVEQVLCPPFMSLMPISAMLVGTEIGLGAQNLHWEEKGAFTGEVSPLMVKEFCQYVILCHSERRTYFGETDETVHKRTLAALGIGLTAIVCIGETLGENETGQTAAVIERQIHVGLKNLPPERLSSLVIAYEPVWAIGTGRAATGPDANRVAAAIIRPALRELYGKSVAEETRVLYGGSVTGANAAEFFSQPEIDGALVGGASLKPVDFTAIVIAAAG
jgi:triosephosphate isomerase